MTDPTPTEPYAPPPREPESTGWDRRPDPAAEPAARDASPAPPAQGTSPSAAPAWGSSVAAAPVIERRSGPSTADVVFGLLFIAVGLWLFADVSLGLDLPRVRWGELWPLALIALGGWVLLGAARRR